MRQAFAAAAQMIQRQQMRGDQIADMDIVAHAGAVRGGKIRAENVQLRMNAPAPTWQARLIRWVAWRSTVRCGPWDRRPRH